MKALLLLPLLLAGCHSIELPTPYGTAKVKSFGQRIKINELSYDKLKVRGYNNDQVDGMVELFNAGLAAGKKTVTTVP